ncbi:MAG: AMP-binding protein [Acidimicrobiia bacterium]
MARQRGPIEELIRVRTAAHPDATWLHWRDEAHTWRDVRDATWRVAGGLRALGVEPGDRVALMMSNKPEFFWCYFALQLVGAVSLPVNIFQRGRTLEHILGDSGATTVIADADLCEVARAVQERVGGLRHVVAVGAGPGPSRYLGYEELAGGPAVEPDLPDDVVPGSSMYYTSGTTGPPKGIRSTQVERSLGEGHPFGFLGYLLDASGVQPGEVMYTSLPLCHGNALIVSGLGSMALDARLALGERFSASRFLEECRRHEAVCFNTLGGMTNILLRQPPSPADRDHRVRVVLAAGTPAASWVEFEQRFGVRLVEYYGCMDSPGLLLNAQGRVGSIGKPIPGMRYRLVDEDDRDVPVGEVGEICWQHPQGPMTEYLGLPDETARAYRDGWFHSGDLGVVDDEGWYHYRGRRKLSIRRLGRNISAWEIESAVEQHPGVLQAAAHAVPSELGEDEVKLVVVAAPGAEVTPEELHRFCDGRMAYYAVPRFVEVVDELPRTPTERVAYEVLRSRGVTPGTWDAGPGARRPGEPGRAPAGSVVAMPAPSRKATARRGRPPAADSEATRRNILRAAEEMFSTLGYRGASIDRIAEAAKVAPSVIYHYAPSKAQLFAQVIHHVAEELSALHEAALAPVPTFRGQLERLLDLLIELYGADPDRISFLAARRYEIIRNPELPEVISPDWRMTEDLVARLVDAAAAAGELPAGVPVERVHARLRLILDGLANSASTRETIERFRSHVRGALDLLDDFWTAHQGVDDRKK